MYILVDDEERENEGDLIIPAQMATPDAVNFMAKFGRGLICLTLTSTRIEELGLPLMSYDNQSRHQTAFTISIESKDGVTTGISAADRAHTIAVAINPSKSKVDIASPGHVFPLVARDGGVLVRAGHTEASVDISRLAGLNPSSVICEIMNDDGTMARLQNLVEFAKIHGLKIGTIRDLIAYRRRHDNLVELSSSLDIESTHGGDWNIKAYTNKVDYAEHLAMVKGKILPDKPCLVRMHVLNIFDDVLKEKNDRINLFERSMELIGEEGNGVIVLIRDVRATALTEKMKERLGESGAESKKIKALRDYGIGAQILYDIGVRDIILLSNTETNIVGLDGYGLNIVEQRPLR
ncbi:MAG: 3,4-dihydroxy-2-butanone-4-phosphate synthase [Sphingomonadales bacterium]